jgi:hypothetical protein
MGVADAGGSLNSWRKTDEHVGIEAESGSGEAGVVSDFWLFSSNKFIANNGFG